jgi:hypothetical protein
MDIVSNIVQQAVQGDVFHGVGIAATFGVLFHLSIRPIEFEYIMYHFMAASVIVFSLLVYAFGFVKASLFAGGFNVGLLSSIALYRLAFHRCKSFPGPVAAKLTRFYAASLSARNVQYYKELADMHAKYGDFVRTGELSVDEPLERHVD